MIESALSYAPSAVDSGNLHLYPEEYRRELVRLMAMQAYAERLGATELSAWVGAAPDFRDRFNLAKIVRDEARHSLLLYAELEKIGVGEKEALAVAEEGSLGQASEHAMAGPKAVGSPGNEWVDIVLNNLLLDRVGKHMLENFTKSSYRPWAEACRKMLPEEHMHIGFGLHSFRRILEGRGKGKGYSRQELSGRVSFWYAMGLNFFGPPSRNTAERQRRFGLKRKGNEELRGEYRIEVEALFEELGIRDMLRLSTDAYPYVPA